MSEKIKTTCPHCGEQINEELSLVRDEGFEAGCSATTISLDRARQEGYEAGLRETAIKVNKNVVEMLKDTGKETMEFLEAVKKTACQQGYEQGYEAGLKEISKTPFLDTPAGGAMIEKIKEVARKEGFKEGLEKGTLKGERERLILQIKQEARAERDREVGEILQREITSEAKYGDTARFDTLEEILALLTNNKGK